MILRPIRLYNCPVRAFLTAASLLATLGAAQTPVVPRALQVPGGERLAFQAHGSGAQIYQCAQKNGSYAWVLQAPDARLLDAKGKVIGKHFAGPTWEANDGSSVVGKPATTVPSPDSEAIPWLLVNVVKQNGNGVFSGISTIQRLNTKGGRAPQTGCGSGQEQQTVRVPYEADYYFYSRARASSP